MATVTFGIVSAADGRWKIGGRLRAVYVLREGLSERQNADDAVKLLHGLGPVMGEARRRLNGLANRVVTRMRFRSRIKTQSAGGCFAQGAVTHRHLS